MVAFSNRKEVINKAWYHGSGTLFNEFNTSGIGSHFGSLEQALAAPGGRKYFYEVSLSVHNPLELDDLYSWEPYDLCETIEDLFSMDLHELKMQICSAQGNQEKEIHFQSEVKSIIQAEGYDGIIYQNSMEGPGCSVIAFESNQIRIGKIRSRKEHISLR